jgi:hypothetical protein
MSDSDLCIPRNETVRPCYFKKRITMFCLTISTFMYPWAISMYIPRICLPILPQPNRQTDSGMWIKELGNKASQLHFWEFISQIFSTVNACITLCVTMCNKYKQFSHSQTLLTSGAPPVIHVLHLFFVNLLVQKAENIRMHTVVSLFPIFPIKLAAIFHTLWRIRLHATIPCGQAIGNTPKVHILPECFYPKKVLPLRLYSPRDVSFIKGEFLLLPDKFRLFDVFQSMK